MVDYRELIRFAENQIELAENGDSGNANLYVVPAIILSWIAVEAFMNNMLDDFADLPEDIFPLHEVAFMKERRIDFNSEGQNVGTFTINDKRPDYRILEEKISFLLAKFGSAPNYRGDSLWQKFSRFRQVRNRLVHPRQSSGLDMPTIDESKEYVETAQEIIKFVSKHVWSQAVEF